MLMPTLKLHYDGWLLLPAALRRQLGLNSGDRLEVQLVDGAIVLRPATRAKRSVDDADLEEVTDLPAPDAAGNAAQPDAAPTRRGPGRPRKHQAGAELVPLAHDLDFLPLFDAIIHTRVSSETLLRRHK